MADTSNPPASGAYHAIMTDAERFLQPEVQERMITGYRDWLRKQKGPLVTSRQISGLTVAVVALLIGIASAGHSAGIAGIIALLIAAWHLDGLVRGFKTSPTIIGAFRVLAQEGRFVPALILQANPLLSKSMPIDMPALVVYVPDGKPGDMAFLFELASRLSDLRTQRNLGANLAKLARYVNDKTYVPHRRRQLPVEFTGGRVVFLADLLVRRKYLPGGVLNQHVLPCMVTAGDKGPIEMVPLEVTQAAIRT